jgi:S-adenosylmethionine hydrolase
MMSCATLSTDFGIADYACGLLQGVIWTIAPDVEIVPLSHDIPRHDVLAGALLLERSMPYFPDCTVHVMVVDPGVGTNRRPMAARLGQQYFVGPDNGLMTLVYQQCLEDHQEIELVHLNDPKYWSEDVSRIFHGRDIFAPVGAYLARGVPLKDMGTAITDPVLLNIPSPTQSEVGWIGYIIHVDHFGNLSTNLITDHLSGSEEISIRVGGRIIPQLSQTFGDGEPGGLLALIDSSQHLSICVVNGSAEKMLGCRIGDQIQVRQSK